jgi:ACS family D-galactonate transporter-like MFS transporter
MRETPSVSSLSTPGRWLVVLMLVFFAAIAQYNRLCMSVAGSEVFIPKVGISETDMGMVYSAFLIVYTICMMPGGWLIDRVGAGTALLFLGLSMGIFVILTGCLGWFTSDTNQVWLGLMVIRGLAGACSAPLHPGAAHVVAELMPRSGRATANGMITAGAVIGIACSFPVFGWLMDTITWQWAFVVSGVALFIYGLFWRSAAAPVFVTEAVSAPIQNDPSFVPEKLVPESKGRTVLALLAEPSLWLTTLSYAAYGYFQYLFFYWMSFYFKDVLEVSKEQSRYCSMYITLAMGVGMIVGGFAADVASRMFGTLHGRRGVVIMAMCLAGAFGMAGVMQSDYRMVTLFLALAMGVLGMCEGVFWTTATDIGGKLAGLSGAFLNTGGNIGGFISPVITPIVAETFGWTGAIGVACAISVLGGVTWLAITPPEQPSDASPPKPST